MVQFDVLLYNSVVFFVDVDVAVSPTFRGPTIKWYSRIGVGLLIGFTAICQS